jgi:glucose/arabinose dehydrogenase
MTVLSVRWPHLLILLSSLLGGAALHARGYATQGRCEGYPRVQVQTPAGYCVALIADERQGLRFPRRLVEVAPGRFWIVDMGSWEPRQGRLLELTLEPGTGAARVTVLARALDRPHGLAKGPDNKIYVAEASRIWRSAADRYAPETVIQDLPGDGSHPVKEIAFGTGGQLYVSMGSSTDACQGETGQQPMPCPDRLGPRPRAAVYEAIFGGPQRTLQSFKPWAVGLRNSMALAVLPHPGQPDIVLQGENSIDYAEENAPAEEFNHLQQGADYGWPYCVADRRAAHGYEGRHDCRATQAPRALWPAHAAPLHMMAVPDGAATPWAGQLLVAWHGYRRAGHRVMAFRLDPSGNIAGAGLALMGDWESKRGVRPQGAPTGLALDSRGRLFVVEDRNRTVLMLGRLK